MTIATIHVFDAKLEKNYKGISFQTPNHRPGLFDKTDPRVEIKTPGLLHRSQKTEKAKNAGKTPVWNQELQITLSGEDGLEIKLVDVDLIKSKCFVVL
jgi:hypothetical protein